MQNAYFLYPEGTLGDTADPESVLYDPQQSYLDVQARIRAERLIIKTPEQIAADAARAALLKEYAIKAKVMEKTIVPGYTVAGATLSPIDKEFQTMVLARDWSALFAFLPSKFWGQYGMLGKYSFVDQNGQRAFIPFTEAEIRSFVFSPYYTVQPGHICTDEQREMGVAALWLASQRHQQKFPATDWRSIWPIYPGWGYPGQRYGCEKYVPSTWVRIRKPVVIAAAIVAAVYLGPIVLSKITATSTAGSAGTTTGIVGAGTKAGAVTAITTKAGTAAAITVKSGAVAAAVAESTSFFQTVQSGANNLLAYVNKARTIEAIAKGEMPPPPISIVGDTFTDWAMMVAKEQIAKEAQQRAMELGVEYVQRKMTEKEEAKLRAEIQAMQAELARIIPNDVIASPDSRVPVEVQAASAALALKEKRAQDTMLAALAIAVPMGFLLLS